MNQNLRHQTLRLMKGWQHFFKDLTCPNMLIGDDLNTMTNDRLKDIGVTKLKHRDVILNGIKERIHNLSSDDDKDFRPASKQ